MWNQFTPSNSKERKLQGFLCALAVLAAHSALALPKSPVSLISDAPIQESAAEQYSKYFLIDARIRADQYATEDNATYRVDFDFHWNPDHRITEARFRGFFETTSLGDRSIDIDPLVYRGYFGSRETPSHFWFGKSFPLAEQDPALDVAATSAIGTNWVQNQSNALEPRVAGWIGFGGDFQIPGAPVSATLAFSPIFMPTFGPALELSEEVDARGTRYSRLPPQYVKLDGVSTYIPMRYRIDTSDLKSILLQRQEFASLNYKSNAIRASVMTWSAPDSNPQIAPNTLLRVDQDLKLVVASRPVFPRRHYWAARVSYENSVVSPEIDGAYESNTGRLTVGLALHTSPFRGSRLSLGYLNNFPGMSDSLSAKYSDQLGWSEFESQVRPISESLTAKLRVEHHFASLFEGTWARSALEYAVRRNVQVFASASLIAGQDLSYFGTWRSLDSFSTGVRCIW